MARKNKVAKKRQPKGPKEPEGGNETKPLAVNSGETSHAAFFEQLGPSGHLHGKDSLSKDVNIERYSMSTPDGLTPLLVDTPLKISAKRRYGLVGRNGYGKTTLLQNMANYRIENFPRHVRMLLVNQECNLGETQKVIDAVLDAQVERTQLLAEKERLETALLATADSDPNSDSPFNSHVENDALALSAALDEVSAHMDRLALHTAPARAHRILLGLGFSRARQQLPLSALSGGWRVRAELAKALLVEPDLLLLDEPTNHLDFPAVLWLQQHLRTAFRQTLVVVSHDRLFLDAVCTHTIWLDDEAKALEYHRGNCSAAEAARAARRAEAANALRAGTAQVAAIEAFAAKFRDKGAKRQAQVQSKLKTLQKLREALPSEAREERKLAFEFPRPEWVEQRLVAFESVAFAYGPSSEVRVVSGRGDDEEASGVKVFEGLGLAVDMRSRIGVIGANGVGKSTLVKLLLGQLQPTAGEVERDPRARFAFFSQHHTEQLELELSALEHFQRRFVTKLAEEKDREQAVRRHLGRFAITGELPLRRMAQLSGGQKSRVAFAAMTFETPNFIVMDEPTNHLDLEAIDALVAALNGFEGGVLVVSHDTHFLSHVAKEFWSLGGAGIVRFAEFEAAKAFALQRRIGELEESL